MDIQTITSTSVLSRCIRFIGVPIFAALAVALMIPTTAFSQATVNLGTASSFAVLAAAGITNTGITTLTGNVGLSPTTGAAITGLTAAQVTGTIYCVDAAGPAGSVSDPGLLSTAMTDLNTAYLDAAGRSGATTIPTELGGTTLTSGVYKSADGTFQITGELTLNAQNNANSVFIFQMASTFITAVGSEVDLIKIRGSIVKLLNGAVWTQIFWQVGSSATLGAYSLLEGTILANTTITAGTGADINGRLLAGAVAPSGAVTLNANTALPVELTSFTAALKKSVVELNWNTATEVNNYGFEIERLAISDQLLANSQKPNANSWSKIGFVQGHGNSNSLKKYSFEDMNPTTGKLQ